MSYVLDASAIAVLVQQLRSKAIDLLKNCTTLDLAYYELCNTLWKLAKKLRVLSPDEVKRGLRYVVEILRVMNVVEVRKLELDDLLSILEIALSLNLTFYDASYLYVAKKLGAALVTEDSELKQKAVSIGIKVLSTQEYITQCNTTRI